MHDLAISTHPFGPGTMTYFSYKQLGWHGALNAGCRWRRLNPRIMLVVRASEHHASCGLQCIFPPQQHAAS